MTENKAVLIDPETGRMPASGTRLVELNRHLFSDEDFSFFVVAAGMVDRAGDGNQSREDRFTVQELNKYLELRNKILDSVVVS